MIVTSRGGERNASIEHYPFLKAMSATNLSWTQHDIGTSVDLPSAIERYVVGYGAFAVSTEARPGDVVALVDTVGVPVVLRQIKHKPGYFRFVSCAWLFNKPFKLDGADWAGRRSRERSWKDCLRRELMGVAPMRQHEKEIFRVQ